MSRVLKQRDKARDDGDKLATVIVSFIKGELDESQLCLAVMEYCVEQGWNGPACSYVKDLISFQDDITK